MSITKKTDETPNPKHMWAIMRPHRWADVSFAGIPMIAPKEGPQRFIPIFDTREQAIAWNGSDEHCVRLSS